MLELVYSAEIANKAWIRVGLSKTLYLKLYFYKAVNKMIFKYFVVVGNQQFIKMNL